MKKQGIIDRLNLLMKEENLNQSEFADRLGINQPNMSAVLNGSRAFGINYIKRANAEFGLGENWLEKGSEPMYLKHIHNPPYNDALSDDEVILYDIDAAANLKMLLSDKKQNIIDRIRIPNIPRCDGALFIRGDSMYPLLKSGDIVAYKELRDFEYIVYGEMYLVDYSLDGDDYLVVKYVQPSEEEGKIKLVSYNPNHPPMDISISGVRAMALVKASIRFNTMI